MSVVDGFPDALRQYKMTEHFETMWRKRQEDERFPDPTITIITECLESGEIEQSDQYTNRFLLSTERDGLTWTVVVELEPGERPALITVYSDASTPTSYTLLNESEE